MRHEASSKTYVTVKDGWSVASVEYWQVIPSLALPVVTGVVGGVGLVIKDRRESRNTERQASRRLQFATSEVQFINDWAQTRRLVDPGGDDRDLLEWLNACRESAQRAEESLPASGRNPVSVRRIFLLQPLESVTAQIARLLFWASLIILNALGIAALADIIGGAKGEYAFTLSDLMWIVAFFGGFSVLFRTWARAADRKERERRAATPHIPPRWNQQ